jgi:phosphoadenosine phosphosulfate reductase
MSQNIFDTRHQLEELAQKHESIIVSYSTGKDSMIIMDMASRLFRRVIALHMYFVKDLDYIETGLEYAQQRWGCEILQLPHWSYVDAVKTNQYCYYPHAYELADVKLMDIYKLAMQQTGARLLAHGARRSDGLWRRRWFKNIRKSGNYDGLIFPIEKWGRLDVMAYAKTHHLPIPELSKLGVGEGTGIGLNNDTLLWLHDRFPGDFEKMRKVFPYISAVVARREFYGIGKHY